MYARQKLKSVMDKYKNIGVNEKVVDNEHWRRTGKSIFLFNFSSHYNSIDHNQMLSFNSEVIPLTCTSRVQSYLGKCSRCCIKHEWDVSSQGKRIFLPECYRLSTSLDECIEYNRFIPTISPPEKRNKDVLWPKLTTSRQATNFWRPQLFRMEHI